MIVELIELMAFPTNISPLEAISMSVLKYRIHQTHQSPNTYRHVAISESGKENKNEDVRKVLGERTNSTIDTPLLPRQVQIPRRCDVPPFWRGSQFQLFDPARISIRHYEYPTQFSGDRDAVFCIRVSGERNSRQYRRTMSDVGLEMMCIPLNSSSLAIIWGISIQQRPNM